MPIYLDLSQWPACTRQPDCGTDERGTYHGRNCARSRYAAEQLDAWKEDH